MSIASRGIRAVVVVWVGGGGVGAGVGVGVGMVGIMGTGGIIITIIIMVGGIVGMGSMRGWCRCRRLRRLW
jgi:hypothetical protein